MKKSDTAEAEYLSEDRQRHFWNKWNLEARSRNKINEWARDRGDAILTMLRSLSLVDPQILDFGCGTGWLTEELADLGQVTGIDIADEAFAAAAAHSPHITFVAGDVYTYPLLEQFFDVVVSQDVVAHVPDQPRYVRRVAALLKPRGFLIITSTNKFVLDRLGLPPQPPEHIEQWLYMSDLLNLLQTDFDVLAERTVTPLGHKGVLRLINAPKLTRLVTLLSSPARVRAAKERLGLGYSMVVLAQKRPVRTNAH